MLVTISVTGGAFDGASYIGDLGSAPASILVPDASATNAKVEAERVRAIFTGFLENNPAIVLTSPKWALCVERLDLASLHDDGSLHTETRG